MKMPAQTPAIEPVMLEAEPEPLQIDLQRTAVVVTDVQNAFIKEGGMMYLMGIDNVEKGRKLVEVIKRITGAARARGVSVIYLVHRYSPDLRETGGPNSGYWYNRFNRWHFEHPEWRDKSIIRGTWGAGIVDELEPQENEIVVEKPKYSAFFGTDLDTTLKTFNIKYLAFVGGATNICVQATLIDACHLDYFPILITDATAAAGPPSAQEVTIHNVKFAFGWVTISENIIKAMQQS